MPRELPVSSAYATPALSESMFSYSTPRSAALRRRKGFADLPATENSPAEAV